MDSREGHLESFDGTRLYLRLDAPQRPRAAVVVVHGLCEHQGRYEHLTQRLVESGMAVLRFDHRGHGRSQGARAYFDDYSDYVGDIACAVRCAKAQWAGPPLFLYGHSLGGSGAAIYVSQNPGAVRGVVLSSALTRNTAGEPKVIPLPDNPEGYVKNPLKGGICRSPAYFEAVRGDALMQRRVQVGVFAAVDRGVQWLRANPERFVDAVLVLQGGQDGLVAEDDAHDFYNEIAAKDKRLILYGDLMHELLNEPEGPQVMDDIVTWMEERL